MSYSPAAIYVAINVQRLSSPRFYDQVVGAMQLAAVLVSMGVKDAEGVLRELIKLEREAFMLDLAIEERMEEIRQALGWGFPEDIEERMEFLREKLELFKGFLIKEIHARFKNVLPPTVVQLGGSRTKAD